MCPQAIVLAGCVVETWRGGRQTNLSRLLDGCDIEQIAAPTRRRVQITLKLFGGGAPAPGRICR
jgi:hypothetical protein